MASVLNGFAWWKHVVRAAIGATRTFVAALLVSLYSLLGASQSVAQTPMPAAGGARTIVGVVTDTLGVPVAGAEVSVMGIDRKVRSGSDGVFRFDNIAPGTYRVSARALGFVSPASDVVVGSEGARVQIRMIQFGTVLASRTTVASRGGLSGVIADTTFNALSNVSVVVIGAREKTATDSAGKFFVPLKPGSYMLRLEREGYERQIVGVSIPKDEGREIAAWMKPRVGPPNNREAQALFDLNQNMMRATKASTKFLSRVELETYGIPGLAETLQRWAVGLITGGCEVADSNIPNVKIPLSSIAVSDVEFVEVYMPSQDVGAGRQRGPTSLSGMPRGMSAGTSSRPGGGPDCGRLGLVVWLRK